MLYEVITAHQLEATHAGRACRGAAAHQVRPAIEVEQRLDRYDVGFGVEQPNQQAGERPERGRVGVGPSALGDFARRLGDGTGGCGEELGVTVTSYNFV